MRGSLKTASIYRK